MKSNKDNGYHAVVHIMKAGVFAEAGMHNEAHDYARRARQHATAHAENLSSGERHNEAAKFNAKIAPMFTHLEKVLSKMPKSVGQHIAGIADKAKAVVGNITKPKKLTKAARDLGPALPTRPAVFGGTQEPDKTVMPQNRNPGRDARFTYKPYHELTPDNQMKAQMAFRHSKDAMENYHYAHDPKSGDMVHGSRWLAPKDPPQAKMGAKAQPGLAVEPPQANEAVKVLPQHMPGAAVHINSHGHEHNGRFGEVQQPNPQMPGTVRIKIKGQKSGRFEDAYVQPHEVKLSKEIKKSEPDNIVLIQKSKSALKRIKGK